jgi:hypothetical protein
MDRRELLGVLGASAGLIAVASARAQQAGQYHHRDEVHQACLKACQECQQECDETFHHCYTEVAAGKKEHARPLHLVIDCAAFCDLSATVMARESPLMAHACNACAEACKACAAECDRFDSQKMKECANSCRKCERACREMVKAMGGHAR